MSIHATPTLDDAVHCRAGPLDACPLGPQCPGGCDSPPSSRPSDELILQNLGAAVMLCWTQLPLAARERILRQADDVIGPTPVPQIRNEIVKLMLRHAKLQWTATLRSVRNVRIPDRSAQIGSKPPSTS